MEDKVIIEYDSKEDAILALRGLATLSAINQVHDEVLLALMAKMTLQISKYLTPEELHALRTKGML